MSQVADVDYILTECFLAVGQAVGPDKTVDFDAVTWWHDHFRSKFLSAMRHYGNRWLEDRENVTAVGCIQAMAAVIALEIGATYACVGYEQ